MSERLKTGHANSPDFLSPSGSNALQQTAEKSRKRILKIRKKLLTQTAELRILNKLSLKSTAEP
jgi:hypothetical protein